MTNLGEQMKGNFRHGYQVLLAEDDYEMRKLIAWSLNKEGYGVIECEDGNQLMKKLGAVFPFESNQHIDLIVSDIRMPGSTGLQALQSIREFADATPMILITAFPDDNTREMARRLGAIAVVEKPFDVDVLVDKVRRILIPGLPGVEPSPDPVLQHSAPLPFPVNTTFRHCKGAEAVHVFIRDMSTKLIAFAHHIEKVHVVVEDLSPEVCRKHHYHINVQVAIRDDKPIVVSHDTGYADSHENLFVGIRIAFTVARRKLKNALGKRRAKRLTRGRMSL
jgi:CheY-like chemotaxis protein